MGGSVTYSYDYGAFMWFWCILRGHSRTRYQRYGEEYCNRCNHPIKKSKVKRPPVLPPKWWRR